MDILTIWGEAIFDMTLVISFGVARGESSHDGLE